MKTESETLKFSITVAKNYIIKQEKTRFCEKQLGSVPYCTSRDRAYLEIICTNGRIIITDEVANHTFRLFDRPKGNETVNGVYPIIRMHVYHARVERIPFSTTNT